MNYLKYISRCIEKYSGQKSYIVRIGELERNLPIRRVEKNIWIASDAGIVLGDIEFGKQVAEEIVRKIGNNRVEGLLIPEAKAIGIGYFIAEILDIKYMAIARKDVKKYMDKPIVVETSSITTGEQKLVLDQIDVERIRYRSIMIFDDVISTCSTMRSLIKIAMKASAKISLISTIWLEGPWPWRIFREEIKHGKLVFLSYLPIFVSSILYRKLLDEVREIEVVYDD